MTNIMEYRTYFLLLSLLIFGFISCDRPSCESMNPILNQYEYDAKEYKDELVQLINKSGQDRLTFWLKNYYERSGNEYIIVHIQGDSICATAEILVKDWDKIDGIKKSYGKGYRGAQLVGLQFEIQQNPQSTEFVYLGIDSIRD